VAKYNYLKVTLPVILGLGFCILIYQFFFMDLKKPIIVNKSIGIKGKVTGINRARGYKIFIDDSKAFYNFDQFSNSDIGGNHGLGYYVQLGDSINKRPGSDTLKLSRSGEISFWYYHP